MIIKNASDYIAAIEKKQRLERLLREGQKQFSGYGRELFESGMRASVGSLAAAIREYELRCGYTQLAPRTFWTTRVHEETIELFGGTVLKASPFAGSQSPVLTSTRDFEISVSGAPAPVGQPASLVPRLVAEPVGAF